MYFSFDGSLENDDGASTSPPPDDVASDDVEQRRQNVSLGEAESNDDDDEPALELRSPLARLSQQRLALSNSYFGGFRFPSYLPAHFASKFSAPNFSVGSDFRPNFSSLGQNFPGFMPPHLASLTSNMTSNMTSQLPPDALRVSGNNPITSSTLESLGGSVNSHFINFTHNLIPPPWPNMKEFTVNNNRDLPFLPPASVSLPANIFRPFGSIDTNLNTLHAPSLYPQLSKLSMPFAMNKPTDDNGSNETNNTLLNNTLLGTNNTHLNTDNCEEAEEISVTDVPHQLSIESLIGNNNNNNNRQRKRSASPSTKSPMNMFPSLRYCNSRSDGGSAHSSPTNVSETSGIYSSNNSSSLLFAATDDSRTKNERTIFSSQYSPSHSSAYNIPGSFPVYSSSISSNKLTDIAVTATPLLSTASRLGDLSDRVVVSPLRGGETEQGKDEAENIMASSRRSKSRSPVAKKSRRRSPPGSPKSPQSPPPFYPIKLRLRKDEAHHQ